MQSPTPYRFRPASAVRPNSAIPRPVYWAFVVFVFSIPIEGLKIGPLTLAKFSGVIFFGIYLLYHNPALSNFPGRRAFPQWPTPLWGFATYLVIWILSGLAISSALWFRLPGLLFTLVQLMLIFWVASGLLRNRELARHSVLAFASATVFMACANLAQLPGFYDMALTPTGSRVTALGYNPNTFGMFLALGAVALIGLWLNSFYRLWISKALLLLMVVPLLITMVKTGCRTAVVIFAVGLLVNLAPSSKLKRKGLAWMLIGIVAAVMGYLILNDPSMTARLDKSIHKGSMAGRETIFSTSLSMIMEKPLLGWHPVEMWHKLALRLGGYYEERDAHNLYLHLFLEVGAVGAAPFLYGLVWCGWNAWKRRTDHLGLIPFSLWLVIVVSNMTGTDLLTKTFWYVLALSVASVPALTTRVSGQTHLVAGPPGKGQRISQGHVVGKPFDSNAPHVPLIPLRDERPQSRMRWHNLRSS